MRLPVLALAALLAGCVSTPPDPGVRTAFDDGSFERTMTRVEGLPALGYACPADRCRTPRAVILLNAPSPRRVCGELESGTAEFVIRDAIKVDGATDATVTAERPPGRFRTIVGADGVLITARVAGTVDGVRARAVIFFACTGPRLIGGGGIATTSAEAEALATRALTEAARQPI